jgi:hypothetical protein
MPTFNGKAVIRLCIKRYLVIANTQVNKVSTMTIFRYTAIADLAHLLLCNTQPDQYAKAKEPNPFRSF